MGIIPEGYIDKSLDGSDKDFDPTYESGEEFEKDKLALLKLCNQRIEELTGLHSESTEVHKERFFNILMTYKQFKELFAKPIRVDQFIKLKEIFENQEKDLSMMKGFEAEKKVQLEENS